MSGRSGWAPLSSRSRAKASPTQPYSPNDSSTAAVFVRGVLLGIGVMIQGQAPRPEGERVRLEERARRFHCEMLHDVSAR
jgi:hypothetical protein